MADAEGDIAAPLGTFGPARPTRHARSARSEIFKRISAATACSSFPSEPIHLRAAGAQVVGAACLVALLLRTELLTGETESSNDAADVDERSSLLRPKIDDARFTCRRQMPNGGTYKYPPNVYKYPKRRL